MTLYKHKKSGEIYEFIKEIPFKSHNEDEEFCSMVVIYQKDGQEYARETVDFYRNFEEENKDD